MMEWLVVLLLLPVVAILVWPLWRHTEVPLPTGVDSLLEETHQELNEEKKRLLANLRALRMDYAEGKMAEKDFNELEIEYQQRLAALLDGGVQARAVLPVVQRTGLHRAGSIVLLLLVSASSLLLFNRYWKIAPVAQPTQELDANNMVQRLEKRLAADSDDVEGQTMLARSYAALGRSEDALIAWKRVLELEPGNTEALGGMVLLLIQSDSGEKVHEALRHLAQLRQLEPAEPAWLWYQAVAMDQLGRRDDARSALVELQSMFPPGSEKANMVKEALKIMSSDGPGKPSGASRLKD